MIVKMRVHPRRALQMLKGKQQMCDGIEDEDLKEDVSMQTDISLLLILQGDLVDDPEDDLEKFSGLFQKSYSLTGIIALCEERLKAARSTS